MLAGNRAECADDVYSYADLAVLQQTAKTPTSKSKQSATSVTTAQQPHRNSQSRRAVRLREGSVSNTTDQQYYSTPYATMGNTESAMGGGNPVTYHSGAYVPVTDQVISGNNCNDCGDQSRSVTGMRRVTQTEQVHLGDYSVPPDHRKESIEGIKSPNPSEYCDPYETDKLARPHVKAGIRKSLPSVLSKDQSDVYELASAIPDSKKNYQRTFSDSGTYDHIGSGVTLTKTLPDPDDYDHLSTWTGNTSPAKNSQDMATAVSDVGSEQVYGGAYEEPWDTKKRQQNFTQITDKAENLFKESSAQSNDNVITGIVLRKKAEVPDTSVYEEAWDLPEKQKMFELQVQDAQKLSESAKNLSSSNKGDGLRNQESKPLRSPESPIKSSPKHVLSPSKSFGGDDTYESPWDKEGLEQKIQKASLQSQQSPSSLDSPPDFFAPEVPDSSEYQPAWDVSPSSELISRSTGLRTSTGRSTNQRVMSRELAEKIDPTLPLDIQKFYHGGISRKKAEDLMMIHKDGSYLIRRSETQKNVFSLSMKGMRGMPMHIRIGLKNGEYILGENSQPFPTVPEVIDYYTRHELPVQGAGRLKLLYPIMRDDK